MLFDGLDIDVRSPLPRRWGSDVGPDDIRAACAIGKQPLVALSDEIAEWGRGQGKTWCRYPSGQNVSRLGGLMFYDPGRHIDPWALQMAGIEPPVRNLRAEMFMQGLDFEDLAAKFLERMSKRFAPNAGRVELQKKRIEVTAGVRRGEPLDAQTLAEGLFLLQRSSPNWGAQYGFPSFYGQVLAPYFEYQKESNPLRWAAERLSVHVGYAHRFAGDDHPPHFAEYAYTVLAPLVCNTAPAELARARTYRRSGALDSLLAQAGAAATIPEAVIFIAENLQALTGSRDAEAQLRAFATQLPKLLENGLVIDRVTELFQHELRQGFEPEAALRHTLAITHAVYGGESRPWWFQENVSLVPTRNGSTLWSPDTGSVREELAHRAGFAYLDVAAAYSAVGYRLTELGIEQSVAIAATDKVVKSYALGNPMRADRILRFAVNAVREADPGKGQAVLAAFLTMIERYEPFSPIMGILHGPDTDFKKPGMLALVSGYLGPDRIQTDKLNSNCIGIVHQLEIAASVASRTFAERAALPATVGVPMPTVHAGLLGYSGPRALIDGPHAAPAVVPSSVHPFTSWIKFEAQLVAECGEEPSHTADQYFSFFASKFADPMRPPRGFLSFLQAFDKIRDPGMEHTMFVHPNEREAVIERNTRVWAERNIAVATLLDAYLLKLASWREVLETFEWVLAEPTAKENREHEVNVLWEHREDAYAHYGRLADYAEEDVPLLRRLKTLREDKRRAEYADEDEVEWIERDIFDVESKRRDLADQYSSCPWPSIIFDRFPPAEEAEHQERLKDTVEGRRNESGQMRANGRLFALKQEVDVLRFLVGVASRGILSIETVQRVFPVILADLRTRAIDPEVTIRDRTFARDMEFGKHQEFENLERMCTLGVISRESLDAALGSAQKATEVRGLIQAVRTLLDEFLQTTDILRRVPWEAVDQRDGVEIGRAVMVARAEVAVALAERSAHLADGAVGRMLNEYRWRERYRDGARALGQHLTPKLDAALPLSKEQSDSPANVVTGADRKVLTWAFLALQLSSATQIHDVVASAAEDRRLLADPEANGTHALTTTTVSSIHQRLKRERERAVQAFQGSVERIVDGIVAARDSGIGLLPIGGKIHVTHPISKDRFETFRQSFGFDSTHFRLLHAGHSLLIDPTVTPAELKFAIAILEMEGIVNMDEDDLQFGGPGRLPPGRECAILGAAVLLSSDVNVRYTVESFDTTHNPDTNFRIIVYDRGGPRAEFPFMPKRSGRTDILARRSLNDADRFNLVHSVLSSEVDGGPFREVSVAFRARFEEILARHGLAGVLDESWVHACDETIEVADREAGIRHFEYAVNPCVQAWERCADAAGEGGQMGGVVGEVKQLFDWLRNEVYMVQERLRKDPTYEPQRRMLLDSIQRIRDVWVT